MMKREDNRFILAEQKQKCKYCKHLLVNLDSSTTQTCWLSYTSVDVDGVCDEFEFSKKMYEDYNMVIDV